MKTGSAACKDIMTEVKILQKTLTEELIKEKEIIIRGKRQE